MASSFYCPFCRANWIPYFGLLGQRVHSFTDCLFEVLFHGIVSDETNEYVDKCRYMLDEFGREYCLKVLCDDTKRLRCSKLR